MLTLLQNELNQIKWHWMNYKQRQNLLPVLSYVTSVALLWAEGNCVLGKSALMAAMQTVTSELRLLMNLTILSIACSACQQSTSKHQVRYFAA
jgi:hypothetical protein